VALQSPQGPYEVAVVAVTYNSADDIEGFLRSVVAESAETDLAVLVADNGSADDTVARARAISPELDVFDTGGNLGYAGAINAALRRLDPDRPVLILNPDGAVEPGAVATMLATLRADGRVGAVVPRIRRPDGSTAFSQRREPSVSRALGDALLGAHAGHRPGWLSEMVYDEHAYERSVDVDWATGAAVLVGPAAGRAVGEWDDSFFLYSEETDYLRRVREAGFVVRYEPGAAVRHAEGGSGASPRLVALLAVNRVRYVRKHRSRAYAAVFRAAAILGDALRSRRPGNAEALRFLLDESRWGDLPHGDVAREGAEGGSPHGRVGPMSS
jgi:GT2 family glycosyltransferase